MVAAILGTTYLGNAYQSSNSVSNVLFELVAAGALSAVLVPTFVELLDRGDVARMERLAGRLLGIALLLLGVISVIGIFAAPWIADLLTRGVDEPLKASQQQDLSTLLLRFFIPQVMLYAIGAVAVAVLYAKRHLTVTAIAPIGYTVVTVVTMVVFRLATGPDPTVDLTTGEALILAIGGTIGVAAFVGIPFVAAWRSGVRLVPRLGRHDDDVRPRRAPVGVGGVPTHDGRLAPRSRDRRGQQREGRHRRVPGGVRVLPRAVRDPRPAGAHRDPLRPRARGRRAVGVRRVRCAGRSTTCRCWSSR